ncbi:MAG: YfhO family protein [Acidobacteriota bacterium]
MSASLPSMSLASIDAALCLRLLMLMLVAQVGCELLSRALGRRLSRSARLLAWSLPLVLLAPWLMAPAGGERLLVPTDVLRWLPDAPRVEAPGRHDLLNDAIYQFLPWELEVRHALSEGRLPLWSDRLDGGSSPWANPQAGVLSPLHNLARPIPIQHFLLAMLVLKLLVAIQGSWLLARLAGAGNGPSLLAGTGFGLSGGMMAWALFPHTATLAWVPWLAAATVALARRPHPRRFAVTALIAALTLLSGHPETAVAGAVFAGLCGWCLRRRGASAVRDGLAFARWVGAAAVLGAALAAIHLIPFAHVLGDSQRAAETVARPLLEGAALPAALPKVFVPEFADFLQAPAHPRAYGVPYRDEFQGPINWVDASSGYGGLVAWAGAWIALVGWLGFGGLGRAMIQRRFSWRRVFPFLAFAVLSLLLAARFVPLMWLMDFLPALRAPAWTRFLLVGCLALNVAAALAFEALRRRRVPWVVGLALVLAGGISLAVQWDGWGLGLWVVLAGAVWLASLGVGRQRRFRRWAVPVAFLLMGGVQLLDQFPWSRSHLPAGSPGLFYPRGPFVEEIHRAASSPAEVPGTSQAMAPSRVIGGDLLAYPSLMTVWNLAEVRPHNPLADMRYIAALRGAFGFNPSMNAYVSPVRNLDHPLLDFLGVRAAVLSLGVAKPETLVQADDGRFYPYFVFRNPEALPRWFFPSSVEEVEPGAVEEWIRRLDRGDRVAVEAAAGLAVQEAFRGAPPRPLRLERGLQVLSLEPAATERLLATSNLGPEGWRAEGDGESLTTLRINGAFLGVRVPSGVRQVELRYLPPGWRLGFTASALATLLWSGFWIAAWRRSRTG